MSKARQASLTQILADPRNSAVSHQFFRFALLLFVLPVSVLILFIQSGLVSVPVAGVLAVVLVNVIMGVYVYKACQEDSLDWKVTLSQGKRDT